LSDKEHSPWVNITTRIQVVSSKINTFLFQSVFNTMIHNKLLFNV